MVLAIGIVVDDAIVVVEAVERQIEHGLPPREATIRAMEMVSGPVIAVGLVLSAVFIPCTFITGITGQFFRQFALTIAVSTAISAFNSLTLSPALTALLLRSHNKETALPLPWFGFPLIGGLLGWDLSTRFGWGDTENWLPLVVTIAAGIAVGTLVGGPTNRFLARVFRAFNRGFDRTAAVYTRAVGGLLRVSVIALVIYGGLLVLTYGSFQATPKGFIPPQDKGYLLVNVQLPDSASVQRTQKVMQRIEEIAGKTPGIKHTVAIAGQSILLNANAPNFGAMYLMLDDFHSRVAQGLPDSVIATRLQASLAGQISGGLINVFSAPPIDGLGTAGGFKLMVEDRGDTGLESLQTAADTVVDAGHKTPGLQDVFTSFRANTPWLYLDIDREAAKTMGVSITEVFQHALQVYLGSLYVNDFNRFGRTWQVNVQAMPDFRSQIEDIKQIKIRNGAGNMVPLATMVGIRETTGPVMVMRYNMYPSAAINLAPAAAASAPGQAIERAEASPPQRPSCRG